MSSWMGYCLYVSGGIFIQDLKSGMSPHFIPNIPYGNMRPELSNHIQRHAAPVYNTDVIVSRSATTTK
jgi:hypothetical protein